MNHITEIAFTDRKYWDSIVKSIRGYDVFYLNEYVTAFMQEDKSNGEPVLLYYKNGCDCAIDVVFKRDISIDNNLTGRLKSNTYFDLITPYGYGGFLGNVTDFKALNSSYTAYCIENSYVCEFVRFELFSDYFMHYSGDIESRTHNVIRDLQDDIDTIWMDFRQKVRKNVKRANTYGLKITVDDEGVYLDDFLRIYYGTMERSNAEKQFYFKKSFFEKMMSMNNAVMFHVWFEGRIISTELVLIGELNCYSYLGGTDSEYFYTRANDFLKFEIIKWAKKRGLQNFVLGGGYGSDDGIFQYKMNFAPHGIKKFYIGRKIFNKEVYDFLCSLRCIDTLNDAFFPKYRS